MGTSVGKIHRKRQQEAEKTLNTVEAIKMASLLALRNNGWGAERLKRFNDEFNNIMTGVGRGYLSLSDIAEVIEKETGLSLDDLKMSFAQKGVGNSVAN